MAGAGVSNLVLVLFNFLTALLGGAVAGLGAWLATKDPQMCLQFLHKPILCFGVFVAAVSVLALVAAFFRIGILLRLYLLLLVALVLALIAFAIFSFVVTHTSAAKALANISYKQYRISDYSNWLQNHISDPSNWARISACLRDSRMCFYSYMNATAFLSTVVNSVATDTYQGCCVPPAVCGYSFTNYQYVSPTNSGADTDCTTFNNDQSIRCFSCNSCPAGFLQTVVNNWKKLAIGIAVVAAFLIAIYCVGCAAL